jgi:hypothetical protein
MSLIRPILEECRSDTADHGLRSTRLGRHAAWYKESLVHCSEAILVYEWAWLHGRIDALGGLSAVVRCRRELADCQLFRTLLLQEFGSRNLHPPAGGTCSLPTVL